MFAPPRPHLSDAGAPPLHLGWLRPCWCVCRFNLSDCLPSLTSSLLHGRTLSEAKGRQTVIANRLRPRAGLEIRRLRDGFAWMRVAVRDGLRDFHQQEPLGSTELRRFVGKCSRALHLEWKGQMGLCLNCTVSLKMIYCILCCIVYLLTKRVVQSTTYHDTSPAACNFICI